MRTFAGNDAGPTFEAPRPIEPVGRACPLSGFRCSSFRGYGLRVAGVCPAPE